jgi:membrane protein DedA with SNARE-associated domain
MLMTSIMANITGYITNRISYMGYGGIFGLMAIESSGLPSLPIPGELIMTFAGYLASTGNINLILAVVVGTIGTGIGSAIGYAIGAWGGKPLFHRYGKYFGATPDRIARAEKWFCKHGESAAFFTRMLPVVRTIVNAPAGLLKMDFSRFVAYTLAGALPWCLLLSYIGYMLGDNWETIGQYSQPLTYAVVAILAIVIIGSFSLYALVRRGIVKKETVKKYLGFLEDYDFIEGTETTVDPSS